ncbi:MAG: hypothetical protein R3D69_14530 [Xanthobacteraceae bacterium]
MPDHRARAAAARTGVADHPAGLPAAGGRAPPAPTTDPPGCDPTSAPAKHSEAEQAATGQVSSTGQADTAASADTDAPKLDIMRDESHSTRRQKRGE